ncbi:hypothetical protein MLD38_018513 [Melastoma candidum]|uniref:Uncharacterized protein n=1 Tax=Melastoma candidum TaxID=119954 RepID=A0ACB9QV49_9MYRT|nr:hypothetical protein MLD38_018513 [Melastoma candidum]
MTVDVVSAWVVSAFFSSLERFSCVNISTSFDDDDEDDDQDDDLASASPSASASDDNRYDRPDASKGSDLDGSK